MKDYLRDYATEAFRFYARCGKPTYEEMRKSIYNAALQSSRRELQGIRTGFGDPTGQAVINANAAVDEMEGQLLDILAVENALQQLRLEIYKAVDIVYFTDAKFDLERGDIEDRVHVAELEIPASRAQIYRWLKRARVVFARERGLRLSG